MKVYKLRIGKFSGSDFQGVYQKAFGFFSKIKKKSKRRAYVRSAYFGKEKVFLDLFWSHLFEKKNWRDRVRRMRYFACAIDLLEKSRFEPKLKYDQGNPGEMLYRFYGTTKDNELFCVQVKENRKNKQKFLISVFPVDEV